MPTGSFVCFGSTFSWLLSENTSCRGPAVLLFQKAMAKLQVTPEEQAVSEGKKAFGAKKPTKQQGEGSDLYKIVRLVMDRSLDPAIVFSFAKK